MAGTAVPAAGALLAEFPDTAAVPLDLADLKSVHAFCESWRGPVDAVVANAGVMMLPTRQVSAEGWEMQLAVNYLGHFALVLGLHDALRAAEDDRFRAAGPGRPVRSAGPRRDPPRTPPPAHSASWTSASQSTPCSSVPRRTWR
ncbi:hypothetical protein [Streptomyces sp. NPDC060184]|uniref:hypothetical protein n=1 Tax=Streptomyces sp. NPDC060184 TaxID=3347064 RepID=UPI00364676F2